MNGNTSVTDLDKGLTEHYGESIMTLDLEGFI